MAGMSETTVTMGWEILDRMERAVAKVRERLLRATKALNDAGIPYAVVGGHAVASWVAKIDEGAVRNTRDVNLLLKKPDSLAVADALERTGFVREKALGLPMFRDETDFAFRGPVRVHFCGERFRHTDELPAPDLQTWLDPAGFHVINLEPLLEMKLVGNRNIDATHVRDMIDVGLIDRSWLPKLPPVLAGRLQHILDTTGG
jgi:hypothetical protein